MNEPQLPPQTTPDAHPEEPEIRYGGFQRRNMAAMFDILLVTIVLMAGAELFGLSQTKPVMQQGVLHLDAGFIFSSFIVPILILSAYSLAFWIRKGSTPGKMLLSMRIVDAKTLGPPAIWQYAVRVLGYVLPGVTFLLVFSNFGLLKGPGGMVSPVGFLLLLCLSMAGFFWVGLNSKKRGWHDYMAGTVVILDSLPPKEQVRRAMQWTRSQYAKIKKHNKTE